MAIEIKPSKVGTFTEYAKRHGGYNKKTGKIKADFVRRVKDDPNVTEAIRKKAQFAYNAKKWGVK